MYQKQLWHCSFLRYLNFNSQLSCHRNSKMIRVVFLNHQNMKIFSYSSHMIYACCVFFCIHIFVSFLIFQPLTEEKRKLEFIKFQLPELLAVVVSGKTHYFAWCRILHKLKLVSWSVFSYV